MTTHQRLSVFELVLMPILGVMMFVSKLFMEFLPNIHLLGMFIMVFTLVFRWKALIPIYVYVFLLGLYGGFAPWWWANLYVWTMLWGVAMILPQKMPIWLVSIVYPAVCALHGLCYGALCAPAQALFFGLNWEGTLTWVVSGLPYDVIHGVGNLLTGLLIVPFVALLNRLKSRYLKSA